MDPVIIFAAKYLVILIIGLTFYTWTLLDPKKRLKFVLSFILAGIGAFILTKIAGSLYFHPRPFVTEHIKPLVSHGADNGFPSEHAVFAMTLTTLIYFYRHQLAYIALVTTLIVGLGRILANIHAPIDIVAGLVIGAVAGSAGYYLSGFLVPGGQKTTIDEKDD